MRNRELKDSNILPFPSMKNNDLRADELVIEEYDQWSNQKVGAVVPLCSLTSGEDAALRGIAA